MNTTKTVDQLLNAVMAGNVKLVNKLSSSLHKEVLNAESNHGKTILAIAITIGNKSVVQALVDNGADVNSRCSGMPSAFFAIPKLDLNIIEFMIENGFNINSKTDNGHTFFHIALKSVFESQLKGSMKFLKSVLSLGVDPHITGFQGDNSFMEYFSEGFPMFELSELDLEVVDYLLNDLKIDLNTVGEYNSTVVGALASIDNEEVIDLVLSKVNPELYDLTEDSGDSACLENDPLYYAVVFDNIYLAKSLVNKGADTTREYEGGQTIMDMVISKEWYELAALIRDKQ